MAIRGVDFVVHYVPNLEEAVSFYQDTLGLKLELHNPDWNWAEFSLSPIKLVLFGTYPGTPLENGKGGVGIALAVDDFDGTVKELSEYGVEIEWGSKELSTCHGAMMTDPGGNPIFIHKRKDGSWG